MNLKKINYAEAESSKIKEGTNIFNADTSENQSESIQISHRNVISELSDEIRKTLRYYMKSKVGLSFDKFYISGGTSKMSGLIDSLNETLSVKFNILDPFVKFPEFKNKDNSQNYAVSLGLALRGTLKD